MKPQKEQGIGLGLLQGLAVTLRTMTKRSVTVFPKFRRRGCVTPSERLLVYVGLIVVMFAIGESRRVFVQPRLYVVP